jgi:hypothetical protein
MPRSKRRDDKHSWIPLAGLVVALLGVFVAAVAVYANWPRERGGPPLNVTADYRPQPEDWLIPEGIGEIVKGTPIPTYQDGGGPGPDGQLDTEDDDTCAAPKRTRWLQSRKGVVAGKLYVPITVTANHDSTVVLKGIDVVRLERRPAYVGTTVALCPGAGPIEVWRADVDLDADQPKVTFEEPDTGESGQLRFPQFTIDAGDSEEFSVTATSRTSFVRFYLRMRFTVNAREESIRIDDHGRPFEVTACTSPSLYIDAVFASPTKPPSELVGGGGPCTSLVE